MKQKKRINIGLLVSHLSDDFDSSVCSGAIEGANEMDANLIIFPGRYLKGEYYDKERSRTTYQHNTIFSYVSENNIDVLLVLLGTIGSHLNDKEKKLFLDMYQNVPVMLLASELSGYPSVVFDNKSGLREGIEDLIVNKNCKNIGMVSGPTTNIDACERLGVYKEVLEKHGIQYDENRVVYGNFSEYTEEIVADLLNRNPKLDAIVFANDQMAIGGYKAMKKKGIMIGSDMYVMGFDDAPASTMIIPNLTTVRADAHEIGKLGVIEAINYLKNKEVKKSYVNTTLIKRDSTGYIDGNFAERLQGTNFERMLKSDTYAAANAIVKLVVDEKDKKEMQIFGPSVECVRLYFDQLNNAEIDTENNEKVIYFIEKMLENRTDDISASKYIFKLFGALKDVCEVYLPEKSLLASDLLYEYLMRVTANMASGSKIKDQELNELLFQSNSIAKDMLIYGEENDMSYSTVCDKLTRLSCTSAYLYTFSSPFINKNANVWHDWQVPDKILLKSYFDSDLDVKVVPTEQQEMDYYKVFSNPYLPSNRRYTMILNNIFINEEQLGLLLCEFNHKNFFMLQPLLAQLGSAFKIINMLNIQAGIQKQLKISLDKIKESNEMLENISKKDELTGIYNRRGFFEMSNSLIVDENANGKKAIVVFADLDHLKIINDKFGHDEGDYAIKNAAEVLKESFRASDVVARIGGDEFAAVAVTTASITGENIQKRINKLCKRLNDNSGKPYYIEMSVGYAEFICEKGVEIEKYLDMADAMLYENKKTRRQNVEK